MRANNLFKRPKAENGTGRSVKIKHILIPEEVADELNLYKAAYELRLGLKRVTYEQMFRRWLEHIDRIDPDIPEAVEAIRAARLENQSKIDAGLGLTVEQMEENERNSNPTEGEVWELKYFFKRDGEKLEAFPGDKATFYTRYNGRNTGMAAMLKDGWTLINERGVELTWDQAFKLNHILKKHKNA